MLMELKIVPLGRGKSVSGDLADILKIIDTSGLDYRLTATGTNVEGNWDQLMDVARRCHAEMRKKTERVVTSVMIDDYGDRTGRLAGTVESLERKVGKQLKK